MKKPKPFKKFLDPETASAIYVDGPEWAQDVTLKIQNNNQYVSLYFCGETPKNLKDSKKVLITLKEALAKVEEFLDYYQKYPLEHFNEDNN